jgi:hypothetical protein
VADHPLRPDYARPGGPARSIAWAQSVLDCPITSVSQERTWNLSAIWKLGTARGQVWLKQVPRFFWHEAAVLRYLGAPVLIAADGEGRMLMENIPGEDLYEADFATLLAIADDCAGYQIGALSHVDKLRADGVPGMLPAARAVAGSGRAARHPRARRPAPGQRLRHTHRSHDHRLG